MAIPMEGAAAQGSSGGGEGQSAAQAPRSAPGPAAEGMERQGSDDLCGLSVASAETADVYGAPAPQLISRFEHPPPQEVLDKRAGGSEGGQGVWLPVAHRLPRRRRRGTKGWASGVCLGVIWLGTAGTLLLSPQLST